MNAASFVSKLAAIVPLEDESHIESLQALVGQSVDLLLDPSVPGVVFSYMESHQAAYFGSPGPLVHFLERSYPSYIDALISSVGRLPLSTTVWMVNRVLNSNPGPALSSRLLKSLREAAFHSSATQQVRIEALEFLELHAPSEG